jgi:signal peptidase complex subunit 2
MKRKQGPPVVVPPAVAPVKVDVYDQNAVKQLLDDVTMTYVLETRGLDEDLTLSNYKLALGGLSCLVAIASHVYPAPFPENAFVLKACVVSYIVLSVLLQYVAFYMEGNTILTTRPTQRGKKLIKPLNVKTYFPKCDEQFTVQVTTTQGKPVSRSVTSSIGRWFQPDGTFIRESFISDLDQLFKTVEDCSD